MKLIGRFHKTVAAPARAIAAENGLKEDSVIRKFRTTDQAQRYVASQMEAR